MSQNPEQENDATSERVDPAAEAEGPKSNICAELNFGGDKIGTSIYYVFSRGKSRWIVEGKCRA